MTEDEVNAVYEYLHENYEYRDGELIRKTGSGRKKIGSKLGSMSYHADRLSAYIVTTLTINKKRYTYKLSTLIYLYHNKIYAKYIKFIDNNITNCKIENLKQTTAKICQSQKEHKGISVVRGGFMVRIGNSRDCYMGVYSSQEKASEVYNRGRYLYFMQDMDMDAVKKTIEVEFFEFQSKNVKKIKGCYLRGGSYVVQLTAKRKSVYVGRFKTEQEAHAAYLKAKKEHA